jgi:hypothetical protein
MNDEVIYEFGVTGDKLRFFFSLLKYEHFLIFVLILIQIFTYEASFISQSVASYISSFILFIFVLWFMYSFILILEIIGFNIRDRTRLGKIDVVNNLPKFIHLIISITNLYKMTGDRIICKKTGSSMITRYIIYSILEGSVKEEETNIYYEDIESFEIKSGLFFNYISIILEDRIEVIPVNREKSEEIRDKIVTARL